MTKKNKKTIKGKPAYIADGVIMKWYLNDGQTVPAIEQCQICVVKYPVAYYQSFNFSPEAMAIRKESIRKLGWSSESFDLPFPPKTIGRYSLLSDALNKVENEINNRISIEFIYPSTIKCLQKKDGMRNDYCMLFFNHSAYEFYQYMFALKKKLYPFEFTEKPKYNTLKQLFRWSKSFEYRKYKMYKDSGLTWEPILQGS